MVPKHAQTRKEAAQEPQLEVDDVPWGERGRFMGAKREFDRGIPANGSFRPVAAGLSMLTTLCL
jgi:hypothetical protein